jgi:deoxyguanosine kinase
MLIVVEGCVGAGKSTVAEGLASRRGSKLLLEDFESNPFLRAFYDDPIGNATETEFAFLLLHFHQLKDNAVIASNSEVVADFHLGKDLLYADLNFKDNRLNRLFTELYDVCMEKTPRPDLMIQARKRDFELEIDPAYFGLINAAYEEYFARYSGKKLRIPMEEWDFVKEPHLYERLASLVDGELHRT